MVAETFAILQQTDASPSGSIIAPNAFAIICYVELGKPYMQLALQGINPVMERNAIDGKGRGGKANGTAVMAVHRDLNFAPTRKGADFPYGNS